jgi:GT2 family glycosyltransferase
VAGYHVGAAKARADLLFFCNEDMWFDPNCLKRLAERIDMTQRIAAADGWHWTYDGKEWLHGGTRFTGIHWAVNSPHPRRAADFQVALPAGELVPFPCAGAFLIHRDAYWDVGGWDGGFFLDHEDIDLFLRAWQRRWKCVSVPEAKIYHALNASKNQTLTAINQSVTKRRYISQRANMGVIALKYFTWHGVALAALHWPVVFLNNVVKLHWKRAGWDFLVLRELARRFRATWAYRRTFRPYLRYFPGESFFHLAEFSK